MIDRCLIIDDDELDQMLFERVLKRSGRVAEVVSFLFAEEALHYLETPTSLPVDVILLDINMPRMNGFEFLERVSNPDAEAVAPVVVMLTSSPDPGDVERAMSYACVKRYLSKPLTEEQVCEIDELLLREGG